MAGGQWREIVARTCLSRLAVYDLEMRRSAYGRVARFAAMIVAGLLLFVASSFANRTGRHLEKPVCTHGASSIGPIFLRASKVVGGNTTPHTEACLR